MTPLISCRGLQHAFAGKPLFDQLSLAVDPGERMGLVGANGSGKSTLLKILAGVLTPDEGDVIRQRGVRVSMVEQDVPMDKGISVIDFVHGQTADDEHAADPSEALSRCGFQDSTTLVENLSGGWKKRLQLAVAISTSPDLVLFDEPTNHMDLKSVLWLQDWLKAAKFGWVLVSHDRYFLEATCQKVTHLDPRCPDGVLTVTAGYRESLQRLHDYFDNQQQYARSLASKVRREDEWLLKGPKARTTKAKGRIEQAHQLKDELSELKSKMTVSKAQIAFSSSGRQTKKLIEANGLSLTLGERRLVTDLDLVVGPGDRLGILGDNGSGKSSLLKLLAKQTKPSAGEVRHAQDLGLAFFDQHRKSLDPAWTLKRALSDTGDTVLYQGRSIHVASWALRFRFTTDQLGTLVQDLSGGEQARLVIARFMLERADVLLLDEPTNDLDIPTLEVLGESLEDFPGGIVLVSHDRYLMSQLCTGFVGLDGEGQAVSIASYNQWERSLKKTRTAKESKETKAAKASLKNNPGSRKKLTYRDQREFDGMEQAILEAEETLAEKQAHAEDPEVVSHPTRSAEAFQELEQAQKQVEALYQRWAELESKT